MNVLVTVENHFIRAGKAVYFNQTSRAFFERYRDVWDEVVVLGRLAEANEPPQGFQPFDMQGIRLAGLPDFYGPEQYLRKWRKCRTIVRQTLDEVDSIVLRAPGTVSNIVWSQLRGGRRPFGVEAAGDPAQSLTRGAIRHPLLPLIRWVATRNMRQQCRAAHATAYVTERTLQRSYPPARGCYSTFYSSIELKREQLLSAPRPRRATEGPFRLVLVGTLGSMYKGQDILLKAAAQLVAEDWDVQVSLVGGGKHLEEIVKLAGKLGLAGRASVRGEVPAGQAIVAELDAADLFVMPSLTEGLPKAMVEAMARGLPCIGSNVGGIPELLDSENMFAPADHVALAEKIAEVLRDPARMQRMSARNLEIAASYTVDVLRPRRIAFYQHLRVESEAWRGERNCSTTSVEQGKPVHHAV